MDPRAAVKRKESLGSGKGGENFKVAVRVRPLILQETKSKASECVNVDVDHKAVVIEKPQSRRRSNQIGIDDFGELVRSDTTHTHNFFFDIVFGPNSAQNLIFEVCVQEIVESVLQGYNGSVIASGQTGSGKTYTIEGGLDESAGIIPRATELIYSYIENYPCRKDRFLVRASFLEIYNERISDLIDPNRENLKIREDGVGGVYVEGLSEHVVHSTDGIIALLRAGTQLRTTATTRMNRESSRSHAVFTIIVEHAEYDESGGSVVTIGKLRLVDLAGSERLDVDAQSRQQEETKNINVSLHTFGMVVTALTTPGAKHIPYRDSKLTRILQDSLGGNCKTTLIATITPVSFCYTESLNTLKFAKRAKSIKNTAQINKDMSQKALLSAYQQEIKKLKEQLKQRDMVPSHDEIERLEREREEAEKEKVAVLSQLELQQKIMSEAKAEKKDLLHKISQMEKALLHGGGTSISESEEFKKAVQLEQDRIRSQLESKFAELEAEKKQLQDERVEVQKQKDYFAKMRSDFQPDGENPQDDDGITEEVERGSSPVKPPLPSIRSLKKPSTAPSSLASRPPPSGAHIPTYTPSRSPFPVPPRRISSADSTSSRDMHFTSGVRRHSWIHPHSVAVSDYDRESSYPPHPREAFMISAAQPLSIHELQSHARLDDASAVALKEYAQALSHPRTGIPCQEVSGVRIFTGSTAVKWFMMNMEGVTTVQVAQDVGQRLVDLNVLTEIQGHKQFVISDSVYYQFCEQVVTQPSVRGPLLLSRPVSYSGSGSQLSLRSGYGKNSTSLLSASGQSSDTWSMSSAVSLSQSLASLQITADLLEHFGLTEFAPSQLHVAALYGDRGRVKTMAREISVDCLDAAGHTPLMYAVMGKQTKCCLQLIRLGADVNAANQSGQTPLLLATDAEHSDIIKLLLKNGAQTHFVDQEGKTAFHLAANNQNYKCLEYLCKYAALLHGINERDHHYHTPLHISILAGLPVQAKRLLSAKADLGVSDEQGRTALHYAASRNDLCSVQAIVESAPNEVNLVDTSGWSALHLSCYEGTLDCVNYLTSCPCCDINLRDHSGCTPLHIAVLENKPAVVQTLVKKGANVTLRDNTKKVALQYCMELGHTECVHAIQSKT